MPLSGEEIQDRVTYHAPSEEGVKRHAKLSGAFAALIEVIEEVVPDGREKSLAITNAEQSKMWSSAGVARNPETL